MQTSLKDLQINRAALKDPHTTRIKAAKTGEAIHEINRIAADRAKRTARKPQAPPTDNSNTQPFPTRPRCQRTFCAHRSRQAPTDQILQQPVNCTCASADAPTVTPTPNPTASTTATTILITHTADHTPDGPQPPPPPPLSSSSSSSATAVTVISATTLQRRLPRPPPHHFHHPYEQSRRLSATTITPTITSYVNLVLTCPHCHRPFTSCTSLSGHLRIHRTETGAPVS
ncbi:hypothetical protein SprV_0301264100 [Sparganum proliferum]